MRSTSLLWVLAIATSACGGTKSGGGDDDVTLPMPVMIPGGGVGGGSSAGVVNLFVIDDVTRQPIAGAQVRIGAFDGTTDATGLVVATGLEDGPQDVIAMSPGYRAERWIGANGVNMTMDLHLATEPPPDIATLSGTIDLGVIGTEVTSAAQVTCSQTDDLAFKISPGQTAGCSGVANGSADVTCDFTITCRTGTVAVLARIVDTGSSPPDVIHYAYHGPVVADASTVQDLGTLVNIQSTTVHANLGAPPTGLNTSGLIGVELNGDAGIFQIPMGGNVGQTVTVPVPVLTDVDGMAYRLTGVGLGPLTSGIVATDTVTLVRHALTTPNWLAPTATASISTTDATWTAVTSTTAYAVEYVTASTALLSVTMFDGSTSFTASELVPIPAGAIARVNAIAAPGLDLTSFGLDHDRELVTMQSQRATSVK